MKSLVVTLIILVFSQSAFSKIFIEGVSAQKLALEIFQMTERKTTLKRFNGQREILWKNIIRCNQSSSWSCELLGVNESNIVDRGQKPEDMNLLDEDIYSLVDDLSRNQSFAITGQSTSGWVQKLFYRINQPRLRLLESSTRRRDNVGFLRVEFVSCLIRPQRLGDIHYCWLRGVNRADIRIR